MFNIGAPEMMVLFLVGLLVFGPERLPGMMRNIAKGISAFRAETQKATNVLRAGLEEGNAALTGVFDVPDDHEPVQTAPEPPAPEPPAPEPPAPEPRPAPPPSDHPVNEVVREYEDT